MMQMKTIDFSGEFWDLRVLLLKDASVQGEADQDVFVWFIARHGEDNWLALALSSEVNEEKANLILARVDGGLQDAYITWLGEPWDIIAVDPIPHSQIMRDIIAALSERQIETLRGMSHEEIRELRESEAKLDAWINSTN